MIPKSQLLHLQIVNIYTPIRKKCQKSYPQILYITLFLKILYLYEICKIYKIKCVIICFPSVLFQYVHSRNVFLLQLLDNLILNNWLLLEIRMTVLKHKCREMCHRRSRQTAWHSEWGPCIDSVSSLSSTRIV